MDKDAWIAGYRFGGCIALEIIFWLLFLVVFLTGLPGFIAVAIGISLIIVLNWGKARYSCPYCNYSIIKKAQ
jgi:hypothetical protein